MRRPVHPQIIPVAFLRWIPLYSRQQFLQRGRRYLHRASRHRIRHALLQGSQQLSLLRALLDSQHLDLHAYQLGSQRCILPVSQPDNRLRDRLLSRLDSQVCSLQLHRQVSHRRNLQKILLVSLLDSLHRCHLLFRLGNQRLSHLKFLVDSRHHAPR